MKIFKILALSLVVLSIISCAKDDEAPGILITSPADGTAVSPGGTFNLIAIITDNVELDSISYSDGVVKSFVEDFDEIYQHAINTTITVNINSVPGPLPIEVTAVDLEGNKASDMVIVQVQ